MTVKFKLGGAPTYAYLESHDAGVLKELRITGQNGSPDVVRFGATGSHNLYPGSGDDTLLQLHSANYKLALEADNTDGVIIGAGIATSPGSVADIKFTGMYGTPEHMRLTSDGELGIGVSPLTRLDVGGGVRAHDSYANRAVPAVLNAVLDCGAIGLMGNDPSISFNVHIMTGGWQQATAAPSFLLTQDLSSSDDLILYSHVSETAGTRYSGGEWFNGTHGNRRMRFLDGLGPLGVSFGDVVPVANVFHIKHSISGVSSSAVKGLFVENSSTSENDYPLVVASGAGSLFSIASNGNATIRNKLGIGLNLTHADTNATQCACFRVDTNFTTPVLRLQRGASGGQSLDFILQSGSSQMLSTAAPLHIGTSDAFWIEVKTNSIRRIFIDANGEVGINQASPSFTLDVSGTGRFTGALTSGGADPPFELFWNESRQSVVERIRNMVQPNYLDGCAIFYNGELDQMELFLPSKGEFRSLVGQLLTSIDPITETYEVKDKYHLDEDTGEVINMPVPVPKAKHLVKKGYELDPWTGKFHRLDEETSERTEEVIQSEAVHLE